MNYEKLPRDPDLFRRVLELRAIGEMDMGDIAKELRIDSRYMTPLLRDATKWLLAENQNLAGNAPPRVVKSPIEQRIMKKFQFLKDVYVVPGSVIKEGHEYNALLERWAIKAAYYLDNCANAYAAAGKELHVCMSGGETIFEVVSSLPERDRRNVCFYSSALIGRPHRSSEFHLDAIANATIAWSRSGRRDGHCLYATVNPYDLSGAGRSYKERSKMIGEEIDELLKIRSIRTYIEKDLAHIDVAIAGLGMVIPPAIHGMRANRLTASNLLESIAQIYRSDLRKDGAIGEIGYCYFDSSGNGDNRKWRFYLTAGDHDDKLRGVGFYRDMVKRNRDVIVCAGAFKEPAIAAALKGQLFNIWVTNQAAAETILNEDGST